MDGKFNPKPKVPALQIDLIDSINANPNLPEDLKQDLILLIEIYRKNGLPDSYIKGVLADITKEVLNDYSEDKRFNKLIGRKAVNEIRTEVEKIMGEEMKRERMEREQAKIRGIRKQ